MKRYEVPRRDIKGFKELRRDMKGFEELWGMKNYDVLRRGINESAIDVRVSH